MAMNGRFLYNRTEGWHNAPDFSAEYLAMVKKYQRNIDVEYRNANVSIWRRKPSSPMGMKRLDMWHVQQRDAGFAFGPTYYCFKKAKGEFCARIQVKDELRIHNFKFSDRGLRITMARCTLSDKEEPKKIALLYNRDFEDSSSSSDSVPSHHHRRRRDPSSHTTSSVNNDVKIENLD